MKFISSTLFLLVSTFCFGQINKNKIIEIGEPADAIGIESVKLSGKVIAADGEELPGASIILQGTTVGTTTDERGKYELKVPPGIQNVVYSFVGMEPRLLTFIIFKNGRYDVLLNPDDIELQQVTVEANPDRNIASVMPGVERLGIEEIETLPTLLGEVDVVRSLQLLPGVTSVGEGSGGFNVRGGKSDQNLILFNNVQIFNSSHVLGFFSAFNPEVIEGFSLYKGFIPAQYGGRISSVLDVRMKTGNPDKITTRGSVGIISSSLVVDGPAWRDATFLLGGRTSYSDWILSAAKDNEIRNSDAYFNDFNAALRQQIGKKHFLTATAYRSGDFFRFSDNFSFEWQNLTTGIEWQYSVNEWLISQSTVDYGRYTSAQEEPEGADATRRSIGINYYSARQNFIISRIAGNEINLGFEYTLYKPEPEKLNPAGNESGILPTTVNPNNGDEMSIYLNDEIKISEKLSAAVGFRQTFFRALGPNQSFKYQNGDVSTPLNITDTVNFSDNEVISRYSGFEPRLSLRLRTGSSSSFKLSYTRLFQYIHSISNTAAPTPTDLWQLSNNFIRPLRSDNLSIGYFKNFSKNIWELSADMFFRNMNDVLEYRDFADLIGNSHLETELLQGQGRSYGFEFMLKKKSDFRRWSGWVSYTFSKSEVQISNEDLSDAINQGDWFPANYDRPHNFVLVSSLRIGKKSSFDANFTYTTGRPITAIESAYQINNLQVPNFSDRNKYRIPDYIRLDLGVTIAENIWKNRREGYQFRRYKDKLTISLYNVLGRKNAYSVFFIRPEGRNALPKAHRFSVLGSTIPALSYQFKF